MAVSFDKMDFNLVLKDLGSSCLGKDACGGCEKEKCLIGYAKDCTVGCVKDNVTYVENGFKNLPMGDFKSYDKEKLIVGIADILHLCASCHEEHYENCIVNIIRSCYELDLFGELQEYNGSAIDYIITLNHAEYKKGIAAQIVDQFHKTDYLMGK